MDAAEAGPNRNYGGPVDYIGTTARPSNPVRPGPVFGLVIAATAFGAWLCATETVDAGIAVFVFVIAGWVLSLTLHEFAHAITAFMGGDTSVISKGYLTLDPRRYADPVTSIALPLLFLVLGGIGLPGGAVWINRGAIRPRIMQTIVSLAGPAANLVCAAVCLLPITMGFVSVEDLPVLAQALTFLGFLQIVAVVLNLLPVPGLDGFGALEPFLPRSVLTALAPVRRWGMLLLIGVLFYVDPVRDVFWETILSIMDTFSVDTALVDSGWRTFRFWS